MKKLKYILIVALVLLPFLSCADDEDNNVLPIYPVNFKINLNSTDAVLNSPGNYKEYINGRYPILATESLGYGGLIIVNSIFATNEPDLFAFDLSCPNEKIATVIVKGVGDGTAKCERCGRVYDLMANGRVKGESSGLHLQRYRVRATSSSHVFDVTR